MKIAKNTKGLSFLELFIDFLKIQKMTTTKRGIVLRHEKSERIVDAQWSEVHGGAMVSFKGEEVSMSGGLQESNEKWSALNVASYICLYMH